MSGVVEIADGNFEFEMVGEMAFPVVTGLIVKVCDECEGLSSKISDGSFECQVVLVYVQFFAECLQQEGLTRRIFDFTECHVFDFVEAEFGREIPFREGLCVQVPAVPCFDVQGKGLYLSPADTAGRQIGGCGEGVIFQFLHDLAVRADLEMLVEHSRDGIAHTVIRVEGGVRDCSVFVNNVCAWKGYAVPGVIFWDKGIEDAEIADDVTSGVREQRISDSVFLGERLEDFHGIVTDGTDLDAVAFECVQIFLQLHELGFAETSPGGTAVKQDQGFFPISRPVLKLSAALIR